MLNIVKKELLIAYRRPSEWANPLIFFAMIVALFPLAIKPEASILQTIAPGIIFVGVLLSTLISLERLFRLDYEDGSLDHLLLSDTSFTKIVLAKIISHWLLSGLPIIILSPVFVILLQLNLAQALLLFATLVLSTPILSLVGAFCAALTLIVHRGGLTLSLLVLPLYMPILIFSAGSFYILNLGENVFAPLAILLAFLIIAVIFVPLITAPLIKAVVE